MEWAIAIPSPAEVLSLDTKARNAFSPPTSMRLLLTTGAKRGPPTSGRSCGLRNHAPISTCACAWCLIMHTSKLTFTYLQSPSVGREVRSLEEWENTFLFSLSTGGKDNSFLISLKVPFQGSQVMFLECRISGWMGIMFRLSNCPRMCKEKLRNTKKTSQNIVRDFLKDKGDKEKAQNIQSPRCVQNQEPSGC
jgi:hypothetical protein